MLRDGDGVGGERVDDEAPVLGGGGEVDVIDPDPRAADDAEPSPGGLEDVAADLGPGPDDERIAEGDLGAEVLEGEAVGAVDVGELLQQGQPRGAELLGDEDRGLPRDGSRGGGVGGGGRRRGGRGRDRAAGRRAARWGWEWGWPGVAGGALDRRRFDLKGREKKEGEPDGAGQRKKKRGRQGAGLGVAGGPTRE
jgi:hypothetical protein